MNTMTTPADSETKNAILRTAAGLFQERGYTKTKVVDIARAVGITPASLYWHFSSKEDILVEYLEGGFLTFNERMDAALEGVEGSVNQLRALASAHTFAQLEFRDQAQTVLSVTHSSAQLVSALPPQRLEHIRALNRIHVDRIKKLIHEGIEEGVFLTDDANALAFAVLNICEYTALWFRPEGDATAESIASSNGEFAVRMAVGGCGRHRGDPA